VRRRGPAPQYPISTHFNPHRSRQSAGKPRLFGRFLPRAAQKREVQLSRLGARDVQPLVARSDATSGPGIALAPFRPEPRRLRPGSPIQAWNAFDPTIRLVAWNDRIDVEPSCLRPLPPLEHRARGKRERRMRTPPRSLGKSPPLRNFRLQRRGLVKPGRLAGTAGPHLKEGPSSPARRKHTRHFVAFEDKWNRSQSRSPGGSSTPDP
jgi:hypothetical protein